MKFKMKAFLQLSALLLTLKVFSCQQTAKRITCERIQNVKWRWSSAGEQKTCSMNETTRINSNGFRFTSVDGSIGGLRFTNNKEIFYLPIGLDESFPNLLIYTAAYCSIKTISRENFKNLRKLSGLRLSGNKIEKIDSDTFADLVSMEFISLSDNKIKFLNGKAFEASPKLSSVLLHNNECIAQSFHSKETIETVAKVVTELCGFFEEIKPSKFECGKVTYTGGYVIGGSQIKRGQWPFLVGLYHLEEKMFRCAGNLITNEFVLTAAHCIQDKNRNEKVTADDLAILIGKFNLEAPVEVGSTSISVEEIIVHPSWKIYSDKWDADLALIKMKDSVKFSQYIQPICLPESADIDQYVTGTVVGWGRSGGPSSSHENIPRQVQLITVNDSFCYTQDQDVAKASTIRTFCAGGEGSGPCNGDSGGGFYVRIGATWSLKGVVSSSLFTSLGECDVNRYAIYTKVIDFTDWIKSIVDI